MLILRRRKDESIRLEMPQCMVRIQVTSIQGNKVGLGIDAPAGVRIVRDELKPKRLGLRTG